MLAAAVPIHWRSSFVTGKPASGCSSLADAEPLRHTRRKSLIASGKTLFKAAAPPRTHLLAQSVGQRTRTRPTKGSYDANGNMVKRAGSSITYASYNLPTVINSGSNSSTLTYGAFRNRYQQVAVAGGVSEETLYVAGLFERVTPSNGPVQYRHYIPGGNGVAAIHSRSSGVGTTTYVHSDHLGSPELFTRSDGTELLRVSFSAYGERRDGADWSGPPSAGDLTTIAGLTRRGFTGHEHLDAVGLIHMNGRVYDPAAGRFLGADPIVEVGSSQSPNSYSYVWNNPLTMIDPSGFAGEDVTASEPETPSFPDWPYGCPFGFGWRCDLDPWYRNEIFESQVDVWVRSRLYQAYLGNQFPDRKPLLATFSTVDWTKVGDAVFTPWGGWEDFKYSVRCVWECDWPGNGSVEANLAALPIIPVARVESGVASFAGGAYGKLQRVAGWARHHIPADSISPLSRARGPAIQMEVADHALTSSYGSSAAAQAYRQEIQALIQQGRWREAMAREIRDVRRVAGRKYNEAVQQMLEYMRSIGLVD